MGKRGGCNVGFPPDKSDVFTDVGCDDPEAKLCSSVSLLASEKETSPCADTTKRELIQQADCCAGPPAWPGKLASGDAAAGDGRFSHLHSGLAGGEEAFGSTMALRPGARCPAPPPEGHKTPEQTEVVSERSKISDQRVVGELSCIGTILASTCQWQKLGEELHSHGLDRLRCWAPCYWQLEGHEEDVMFAFLSFVGMATRLETADIFQSLAAQKLDMPAIARWHFGQLRLEQAVLTEQRTSKHFRP